MIDYDRTLSVLGVDVNELSYSSGKKVFAVCEDCGTYREVWYYAYRELCNSCSHKGRIGYWHGKHQNKDTSRRIRTAIKGKKRTDIAKNRIRNAKVGAKNPNWKGGKVKKICKQCGKPFEVDPHRDNDAFFCSNICNGAFFSGENSPWFGKSPTEESRRKKSATHQGIPYEEWESYACEQRYCPKFNDTCRESNREKYGRRCFICGLSESENIDKNDVPRKLSVHHVDMDKNQGCNGVRWKLIPVCMSHHHHSRLWEARIVYLLDNVWCD